MLRKTLIGTSDVLGAVSCVVVMLMMLHIVVDVALRWFDVPLQATLDIVQSYYMVPLAFLPLAYVEKVNGHISVELVSQHLSARHQEILIGCVSLVSAAYFAAFTRVTWHDALGKFKFKEMALGDIAIYVWPTRFFLPIGCGLITLFLIYKAVSLFRGDNSLLEKQHADTFD